MRFIFKTSYEQDIRLAKHGGHVFWYSLLCLALANGCGGDCGFGYAAGGQQDTGKRRQKDFQCFHGPAPLW